MSNQKSNAVVVDSCTQRLTALGQYVNDKAPISVNGQKLKASQVTAIYQSCLDSRAALTTKRAETKAAMATRASAEQARAQADRALKAWVNNEFGVGSQEAIAFGFPPPKKASRTVENKANAVLLAQATRKARNTMGKKQKSLIKGVVGASTAPAVPANVPAGASPASQPAVVSTPVAAPQPQSAVVATPVAASQTGSAVVVTPVAAPQAGLAGVSAPVSQPAVVSTPVAAPQAQPQTVNGASAPAAAAVANGVSGH